MSEHIPKALLFDSAIRAHQAGRLAEAEALYRQVLSQQNDHVDAFHMLGILAGQMKRPREAVQWLQEAVRLRADFPEAQYNLGNALKECGQFGEAIDCYQKAVSLRPDLAEGWFNLANALKAVGRLEDAIAAYRKTIATRPSHAGAWNNLGSALRDAGRWNEAIAALKQAIALRPNLAEAHNNLGNLLTDRGDLQFAVQSFQCALDIRSDYVEALNNLGNAFRALHQWQGTEDSYRKALSIQPGSAQTRWNLGMLLLLRGDLLEGFAMYESRLQLPGASVRRDFAQPRWDGSDLSGKTILLHAEQGMGDAIQFVRYAPLVKALGGRVVVMCHDPLTRLFAGQAGIDEVVGLDAAPNSDVQCPLMSLPYVFGTTLQSIPMMAPYLKCDQAAIDRWAGRLKELKLKKRVGLVWGGNPHNPKDQLRSIDLQMLVPLSEATGYPFIGLQKGPAELQINSSPRGMQLVDWSAELHDFADTAALINSLDLVISVDTAVAHLAGALGKPVWLLLPFDPDWRWLLSRPDSPWYPLMRLFRQREAGNWNDPIKEIAAELRTI